MTRAWLVWLGLLSGCLKPNSVTCADGRVCGDGFTCDLDHALCLSQEQASACAELEDGDRCHADGRDGLCDLGACLAACGDSVLDEGEQCDDGGAKSHDGCSSACVLETLNWEAWQSPWRKRFWHGATYDSKDKRVVMFGGYDGGYLDDVWERVELGAGSTWTRIATTTTPSPRQSVLAYDPVRDVVVMFGGNDVAPLGDTWEYDGSNWTQRTFSGARPPARYFHSMVWDGSRNAIVLFGGLGTTGLFSDTWTYDGTTWTDLGITGPPPRAGAAMAYDPVRQKVVMFGGTGASIETWELSGSTPTWTNATSSTYPPGRTRAAMAFSESLGKIVLHGGSGFGVLYGDLWTYDGAWTQFPTIDQPEGTYNHTLTSVPIGAGNDKLVLVGGTTATSGTDQIWELLPEDKRWVRSPATVTPPGLSLGQLSVDGTGRLMMFGIDEEVWTFDGDLWRVEPTTGPKPTPPRGSVAAAFDTTHNTLLVFGGQQQPSTPLDDTWEWTGGSWTTTVAGPSRRFGGHAVYDPSRDVTVMFGGLDAVALADTWEHDATGWRQNAGAGPPAQFYATMAYDPLGKRILLLDPSGDTWAYTGTWAKLDVPRMAPALAACAIAFDPWRERMIVYGGYDTSATLYGELFELTDTGWQKIAVTGAGPGPRYAASMAAHRDSHALVLSGGTNIATFVGDTWFLQYRSDTADEICDDAIDNDSDKRADADDPDCTLP